MPDRRQYPHPPTPPTPQDVPGDDPLVATAEHAARLWAKADALRDAARDALAVVLDLADTSERAACELAHRALADAGVPGRRPLLHRANHLARAEAWTPGRVLERDRYAGTRWPTAGYHLVYTLWSDTELLYVGVTSNMQRRVPSHAGKPWTLCRMVFCADRAEAERLEADLIYQHQPTINRRGRATRVARA